MPLSTSDYAPRTEFDTGRFVARYLQVLAWISIASMFASLIFAHTLRIDLSPLFLFWAASAIKRRSRTARKWVIAISGLTLGCIILMFVWTAIKGTHGMTLSIGPKSISNPALWQVVAVIVPVLIIFGIPFAVLMSERARRQFGAGSTGEHPQVS